MHCPNCGFDSTDFQTVLSLVTARLQQKGRISYRALQYEIGCDDVLLEALREELIFTEQVASDEDGKVLVWGGGRINGEKDKWGNGQDSLESSVQRLELKKQGRTPTVLTLDPRLRDARLNVAERRQLTVMFCDLVGSTALSSRLDPEDLREVVQAYQQTAAEVIDRFAGHIAQYLGDGLLVYFGYPRAHEDDAERAVRTGLEIIAAVRTLNARLETDKGVRLAIRLGIHTGLVVVGEMGGGTRHEQLALGETPNIAARLEALAVPDTIVISAATARLVHGLFILEDLGAQSLKGVAEPITVSRVLGTREEQPIVDDAFLDHSVFLVGRDEEVGLLRRRWEQSKEGAGQVVLITGEAGIGKTSIVDTLRFTVPREHSTRITLRCSPYHQNSALYPIIEHLRALLSSPAEPAPDTRLRTLEQFLHGGSLPMAESVPLFAELLSIPLPEGRYAALNFSPQQHKQHTQDALVAWLFEEAERQPLLLTWEDLQWADPSTLEILGLVIDQAPTVRMLNVLTTRPDFIPPWPMRSHMTPLTLNRLERPQAEALIAHHAGGKMLPQAVIQHVVEKTDGVPLFVEELTKMVLESNLLREENNQYELTGPLSTLAIPSTLQDSLMARLDRLPEVRELAQLGAVLGREFAFEVLRAVTTEEAEILEERLTKLVVAELLYQRGRPPRAKYIFKHALLQDAAYTSLLRSTRQHYHQQIAQLFERQFPEIVETQPEVVAHHYTEAGLNAQAIVYWQRAGQRAIERSANVEASNHLTKGLALIATLPGTPDRSQQELSLQVTLGASLVAIKGYGAPEVEKTYTRARELSRQVGETLQLAPILFVLHRFCAVRAQVQTARELAEELMLLAQRTHDTTTLLTAHSALGAAFLWLGEYPPALEHLQRAMDLYDPQQHRALAFLYGEDPRVAGGAFAAWTLWYLGYPDQARKQSVEALAIAHDQPHPPELAWVILRAAWLHLYLGEPHSAQEQTEAGVTLSTDHGFPMFLATGTFLRGWALAEQGKAEGGLEQMRQGLSACEELGIELWRPYFLALVAETQGKMGQPEEGLRLMTEALVLREQTGSDWHAAELYRLYGELLLQPFKVQSSRLKVTDPRPLTPEPQGEAEECFLKAIEISQRQQAKSWELRATTSLARLWQQQGKPAEAHNLLSQVYNWFTEGFDTKDLQAAKALLEEL